MNRINMATPDAKKIDRKALDCSRQKRGWQSIHSVYFSIKFLDFRVASFRGLFNTLSLFLFTIVSSLERVEMANEQWVVYSSIVWYKPVQPSYFFFLFFF